MGGAFFTQWASGFGARPEHPRHGLFALDPEELRVWPPGASRAETRALGIPEREREREPQRLQNLDWRWWRHEILDRYTDEVCLQDDASIPYMDACDGEFHLKQTCWTRNSRSWESPNGPMAGWEFPHVGTLSVITHQMHKWPITNNPCMVCVSDIDPQNIFKPPLLQDMTIIPYMAWL